VRKRARKAATAPPARRWSSGIEDDLHDVGLVTSSEREARTGEYQLVVRDPKTRKTIATITTQGDRHGDQYTVFVDSQESRLRHALTGHTVDWR